MPPPPPQHRMTPGIGTPAIQIPPPSNVVRPERPDPTGSTRAKILLVREAVQLREEQVLAEVKYFGADLETNAELDKITAQVVAELAQLTGGGGKLAQAATKSDDVEIELIQNLRLLLEKLFSAKRTGFLQRKIEEVQRRITQLFFESELYERISADASEVPAAEWSEQALYVAMRRHEDALIAELDGIPVSEPDIREKAKARLQTFIRTLGTDFLTKTTPELEKLLTIYREVLIEFFIQEFPQTVGEFAWEVIRESRVAKDHDMGYKITADRFPAFREVFDRKFVEKLVFHIEDPIARRAIDEAENFREATLRFVAEPRIHTEICAVINDAIYDYLHGEGYLDLPPDWRRALHATVRS
jgi:hypothetical protein